MKCMLCWYKYMGDNVCQNATSAVQYQPKWMYMCSYSFNSLDLHQY